jgi:hypothetical protein
MSWISAPIRGLAAAVATLLLSASGAYPAKASAAYPATTAGVIVYVSPSGDDANPGTSPSQPLRSLQRARDVVRTLNADLTGDLTVSLADGTYQLTQPPRLERLRR